MYHQYREGYIEVICGCMFAGKTDNHIALTVLRIAAILICSIFLRYIIGIIVSLIVRKKSYILVISTCFQTKNR